MTAPYVLEVGVDGVFPMAAVAFVKREIPMIPGFRLRPYERIIKVSLSADRSSAGVLVQTYMVREMKNRTQFLKRGRSLTTYIRQPNGFYEKDFDMSMTVWDDDFVPTDNINFGRVETAEETTARRQWEAECHRVGTSRNPMDSAARTADYQPHPRMIKYWSA